MITTPDFIGRTCPICFSGAGESCTVAAETGRRHVKWFHSARLYAISATVELADSADKP
jgi:hypothetical protein